jgi:hypothetical protein
LEFDLGAGFEGACGFALVLALSQMMEHGLGPSGRADLHPRRNPLDRQPVANAVQNTGTMFNLTLPLGPTSGFLTG